MLLKEFICLRNKEWSFSALLLGCIYIFSLSISYGVLHFDVSADFSLEEVAIFV